MKHFIKYYSAALCQGTVIFWGDSLKQGIKRATIKLYINTFGDDDIAMNNFCYKTSKRRLKYVING